MHAKRCAARSTCSPPSRPPERACLDPLCEIACLFAVRAHTMAAGEVTRPVEDFERLYWAVVPPAQRPRQVGSLCVRLPTVYPRAPRAERHNRSDAVMVSRDWTHASLAACHARATRCSIILQCAQHRLADVPCTSAAHRSPLSALSGLACARSPPAYESKRPQRHRLAPQQRQGTALPAQTSFFSDTSLCSARCTCPRRFRSGLTWRSTSRRAAALQPPRLSP